MSRLLIVFIGVIVASLFLVSDRPSVGAFGTEGFAGSRAAGLAQGAFGTEGFTSRPSSDEIIKGQLNFLQYQNGKVFIGFYLSLLINRTRRLRTEGDTTLDKDIRDNLLNQIKERSRWNNVDVWIASCTTTQNTVLEGNLVARVDSLPVDPMNYLRFMNSLITLYRDEFAIIKNEKPVAWTRREIDEGTAQDDYKPPAKVPTAVGAEMEKYLNDHIKVFQKIYPTIQKIAVNLQQQLNDMNQLLISREKMPNGFTMRIYVDFEEKNFQKPLSEILKYVIETDANKYQFASDGKEQMTLQNALILTTADIVKKSGVDFTPWFVPIYKGQKKTYKERFTNMGFDPNDYLKLNLFCIKAIEVHVKALRENVKPVDKKPKPIFEGFQIEKDEPLFEYFEAKTQSSELEEDKPFTGQVKDIVYRRFSFLNQAEPAFKEQINICKKLIAEVKKYKDGISEGKYKLGTDAPAADDADIKEKFSSRRSLPYGNAL